MLHAATSKLALSAFGYKLAKSNHDSYSTSPKKSSHDSYPTSSSYQSFYHNNSVQIFSQNTPLILPNAPGFDYVNPFFAKKKSAHNVVNKASISNLVSDHNCLKISDSRDSTFLQNPVSISPISNRSYIGSFVNPSTNKDLSKKYIRLNKSPLETLVEAAIMVQSESSTVAEIADSAINSSKTLHFSPISNSSNLNYLPSLSKSNSVSPLPQINDIPSISEKDETFSPILYNGNELFTASSSSSSSDIVSSPTFKNNTSNKINLDNPLIAKNSTLQKDTTENTETKSLEADQFIDVSKSTGIWNLLHISQDIYFEAVKIYDNIKVNKMVQSRRPLQKKNAIIASILFIICRNKGYPRTFTEICNVCDVSKRDIGMYYKLMLKVLNPELINKQSAKPEEFIHRWCCILKTPDFVSISAAEVYYNVDKLNLVPGKCHIGVSAACIWFTIWCSREYVLLSKLQFKLPQDIIVSSAGNPLLCNDANYTSDSDLFSKLHINKVKSSLADFTQKDVCKVASVASATLTTTFKLFLCNLKDILPTNILDYISD
ncbi:hypothetical protein BB561_005606 [Smittium simulii]|uniref:Transcription factor TFIIB cyclin-like domain-containing protein n=1 Tax=Smittium simulii TaxID=133385 RepID=A0A2T9Y9K1_9FUNG|nr:hypothetical protein BB561_005606 [Smittium simulii]